MKKYIIAILIFVLFISYTYNNEFKYKTKTLSVTETNTVVLKENTNKISAPKPIDCAPQKKYLEANSNWTSR